MILGTRRLFLKLLRTLRIDLACDVGSMNGAEALAFRTAVPRARVVAFEPNPHNLRLMLEDRRLAAAAIEVWPEAVSDIEGPVTMHLVDADYTQPHHRRGMSSLYQRADPALRADLVTVDAVRLDRRLAAGGPAPRRIALWLDVEGKAFEALRGAHGIYSEIELLHVEVEAIPCIAAGQKLYPEVRALLESAGFVELATDRLPGGEQFNAVYIRRGLPLASRIGVTMHCAIGVLRHSVFAALRSLCPTCAARVKELLVHPPPAQRASGATSSPAPARDR